MADYLPFFGFAQSPFEGTAHRRSAVATPSIQQAAAHLARLLEDEWPAVCVNGPTGIGKTHLSLALSGLLGDAFQVVRVDSSQAWPKIIQSVRRQLGLAKGELSLEALRSWRDGGKRLVLVIDHAQRLGPAELTQLDELLAHKLPTDAQLVQSVLLTRNDSETTSGERFQAWLGRRGTPEMEFDPLSVDAVAHYIERHLAWAGCKDREIFTGDAVEQLHSASGGNPEILNRICEQVLRRAGEEEVVEIDGSFVQRALSEPGSDAASAAAAIPLAASGPSTTPAPEPGSSLLNDLADGFLERLEAWEPGRDQGPEAADEAASVAPETSPPPDPVRALPAAQSVPDPEPGADTKRPRGRKRLPLAALAGGAVAITAIAATAFWALRADEALTNKTDTPPAATPSSASRSATPEAPSAEVPPGREIAAGAPPASIAEVEPPESVPTDTGPLAKPVASSARWEPPAIAAPLLRVLESVEWPEGVFAQPDEPLRLIVLGDEASAGELAAYFSDKSLGEHAIVVSHSAGGLPKPSHVLYVEDPTDVGHQKLLARVRGAPILTVSDAAGFSEASGMVELRSSADGAIELALNLVNTEEAKLGLAAGLVNEAVSLVEPEAPALAPSVQVRMRDRRRDLVEPARSAADFSADL